MQKRKCFLKLVLFLILSLYPVYASGFASGGFDFNDGTTQGWTLDQMYVTSSQVKFSPVIGYSLVNSGNRLSATTGSLLIGRSDQNDIYLESPDLSANPDWQGITGYSLDVVRTLYSPGWGDLPGLFYFQLQIKVIDTEDGNKEKLFAEHDGTDFVFHEIQYKDQQYLFTWQPSWLTGTRYIVKKIRLRITGPGDVAAELWYRGSWDIDNVNAITSGTAGNTGTGSNVEVNLGNGVTATYNNVLTAGNTTLTISNSLSTPPDGFTVIPQGAPVCYNIQTTATYNGNITISIQYSDAGLTAQQEASLKLMVWEYPPGQWVDITTSLNTTENIISGSVTHLSDFAVMFSEGGATGEWLLTNDPIHGGINCFAVAGANLFAGTEWNGILLSTDNGDSWNLTNTGLSNLTVRALCANETHVFAGTWGGGVFRSSNNGASWTAFNTGLTNLSVAALFLKGNHLLAGTWGGGVFHSTDSGAGWTAVTTGMTELHIRALFICGLDQFHAGTIDGLFICNDGATWAAENTGLTNTGAISLTGIPEPGGEHLFAGTDGGGVHYSGNYGVVWTPVNTGLANLHIPYLCANGLNLFAATWGGGVFMTNNLGSSWTENNGGMTDPYVRTLAASGSFMFAGTYNGGIWRREVGEASGIERAGTLPGQFALGQNYPNPFNPETTIPFAVKEPCRVTLTVHDLLGRVVATPAAGPYEPGQYRIRFDASELPAGIYVYQARIGNQVVSRKMVVLK